MRDGRKCNICIDRIRLRVLKIEVREPFEMGVDLVKRRACQLARRSSDNLRGECAGTGVGSAPHRQTRTLR